MSNQIDERTSEFQIPNGSPALGAGTEAPAFTLNDGPDRKVSLADLRGRPVILAFYPRRLESGLW